MQCCKRAFTGSRSNKAAVAQQCIWAFVSYMAAGLNHLSRVLCSGDKLFPCSAFSAYLSCKVTWHFCVVPQGSSATVVKQFCYYMDTLFITVPQEKQKWQASVLLYWVNWLYLNIHSVAKHVKRANYTAKLLCKYLLYWCPSCAYELLN